MPQYALLMYHPNEGPPAEQMGELHQRWQHFAQDLKDAGSLVFNQGLRGTDAATTVRVRDGETLLTDGPFAETKEQLAGMFLIEADDLDGALAWAARMPSSSYGSVEVRPVWG
jgi:hypothetical protein